MRASLAIKVVIWLKPITAVEIETVDTCPGTTIFGTTLRTSSTRPDRPDHVVNVRSSTAAFDRASFKNAPAGIANEGCKGDDAAAVLHELIKTALQ